MLALRRRRANVPDDPLAPVLTRIISTSVPITEAWWMPGAWVGSGLHLEGLEHGDLVEEGKLESLVTSSGGAYDVVVTEPIELIRQLLMTGRDRDEAWFAAMLRYAETLLPGVIAERWAEDGLGLPIDHVKLVGAIYVHPVSCCWPFHGDRYHAHCIVPGRIYCDDPECSEHH